MCVCVWEPSAAGAECEWQRGETAYNQHIFTTQGLFRGFITLRSRWEHYCPAEASNSIERQWGKNCGVGKLMAQITGWSADDRKWCFILSYIRIRFQTEPLSSPQRSEVSADVISHYFTSRSGTFIRGTPMRTVLYFCLFFSLSPLRNENKAWSPSENLLPTHLAAMISTFCFSLYFTSRSRCKCHRAAVRKPSSSTERLSVWLHS